MLICRENIKYSKEKRIDTVIIKNNYSVYTSGSIKEKLK